MPKDASLSCTRIPNPSKTLNEPIVQQVALISLPLPYIPVYYTCRMGTTKQICTERLTLSLMTSSDAARVLKFLLKNRKYLAPTEPVRKEDYYTLHRQRALLREEYRAAVEEHTLYRYWITLRNHDQIIGSVLLAHVRHKKPSSCFLGYRLDKDFQRQGYLTEAASAVLEFAFNTLELERIEANIMPGNTPSLDAARRLGFTQVGRTPRYLQINGVWEDHIRTELTRRQWNTR